MNNFITRNVLAHAFLYVSFAMILLYFTFALCESEFCEPLLLVLIILPNTTVLFILYVLINHIVIKKFIPISKIVLFETLLLLAIFVIFHSYAIVYG